VTGSVASPTAPAADAAEDVVTAYNEAVTKYEKLDAIAITIMTTAMTKEVCSMVMMLGSARDIWNKLLSIY